MLRASPPSSIGASHRWMFWCVRMFSAASLADLIAHTWRNSNSIISLCSHVNDDCDGPPSDRGVCLSHVSLAEPSRTGGRGLASMGAPSVESAASLSLTRWCLGAGCDAQMHRCSSDDCEWTTNDAEMGRWRSRPQCKCDMHTPLRQSRPEDASRLTCGTTIGLLHLEYETCARTEILQGRHCLCRAT